MRMYADPFVFVTCCAGKDVWSTSTYLASVHHVWRYVEENHFSCSIFLSELIGRSFAKAKLDCWTLGDISERVLFITIWFPEEH